MAKLKERRAELEQKLQVGEGAEKGRAQVLEPKGGRVQAKEAQRMAAPFLQV